MFIAQAISRPANRELLRLGASPKTSLYPSFSLIDTLFPPVDFACIFIFASSYDSYPNITEANDSKFLSSRISTERIIKFRISSEVLSDNSSNSFTVATIIL